ncbi:conserved exported hypothetical protein [Nostocoides japonicum T1-X7]|uniref:Uncharacterized protein n=1 Tax=Nostocoides japonicum T1-X7 TaxID=1194083 RepID=A0A077M0D7_9MICO|nr:beta-propeller fold lactonase family protein [Tetrasphaera japonica]CCH77659.1 conserved exported hypothetical protein [Tetrasphaera japonica T1-X7]
MKRITTLVSTIGAGAAALTMGALPAGAAPGAQHGAGHPPRGVVFVQNDAVGGNTIVAYDRTRSGGLVRAGSYATGGKGGVLSGSVVDHLASQGSLTYDAGAHLLLAVNAGSDSVTTFAVHGDRLVRRQTVGSGGQFPVSIASHGGVVYVLNARHGGSITGYRLVGGRLVRVPAWHRALHLDTSAPGQPDEFTHTPGQVGFTPDGRTLLVATKAGGNSIAAFAVGQHGLSARPTVTSLPGAVPFGFTFDGRGHLALTEAGPSAVATFAVRAGGRLAALDSAATGQAATCWIVETGGTLYASNAGSGTLSVYRVGARGSLASRGTVATDAGTVDAAASSDGRYVYVQTGAAGIVDAYRVHHDGSLTMTGSVTVPDAAGAEGIVAL